jgi:triacylglycerol lipase
VDKLLNEEDQASSLNKIHQKCMFVVHSSNLANRLRVDRSPSAPVVFCHGLLGFDTVTVGPSLAPLQVAHWRGIKEALEANGCEVLITRVPATSSPVERAKVLEKKISEVYPGRAVHLIGHSMVS